LKLREAEARLFKGSSRQQRSRLSPLTARELPRSSGDGTLPSERAAASESNDASDRVVPA
jgi:hypothetical protein